MAVAGRSYPNVPVIIRGSPEDPSDFGSRTRIVVVAAPYSRQVLQRATITRNTLQDPPVLTTAWPQVIAAAVDRRWFKGTALVVTAPPAVSAAAAPGPLVVSSQPLRQQAVQALITRNTLQDPPVLTTARPQVIAAAVDRRWFPARAALVLSAPALPAASSGLLVAMGLLFCPPRFNA